LAKRELLAAIGVLTAVLLSTAALGSAAQPQLVVRATALPDPILDHGRNGTEGTSGWYKSAVTVWIVENGTVNYSIDGGEWLPYTEPIVFAEDGTYKIEFRGYVNATTNESIRYEIKVDTVIPHTTSNYSTDSLKCTLVYSDATSGVAKTLYRIDGGKWMNYYGPFRPNTGAHMVEYYSIDAAGNSEPIKSISFSVVFNLKTLEAGLIIGLLAVGLGAFFLVVLRGRKSRSEDLPEESPSRIE
jgi:hypothetical protein